MNDMVSVAVSWVAYALALLIVPPLCIGVIRKTKAFLQNRIGAPIHQPLLDLFKLLRKYETVSELCSWVLRTASAGNAAVAILIAMIAPWVPCGPRLMQCDLFMLVYLLVLLRFLTILASMDPSSPFGGFGASREIVLPVLVEPGIMLCFGALAIVARTSDLTTIFAFDPASPLAQQPGLWLLAGFGIYLANLIELSRMPADDPTTHLELTMTHEAMILENSGPNLALTEYAHALKLMVLMGIAAQCFLHAVVPVWDASPVVQAAAGAGALVALLLLTAIIEASAVKIRWTKLPEFIAYAVTFGLLCAVSVLGV
jgi:formate hydrogenlyase subunit 4